MSVQLEIPLTICTSVWLFRRVRAFLWLVERKAFTLLHTRTHTHTSIYMHAYGGRIDHDRRLYEYDGVHALGTLFSAGLGKKYIQAVVMGDFRSMHTALYNGTGSR